MTLRRQVGRRIARARRRHGWTQATLAEHMEVTRSEICRWERGICAPSLEALVKLADVLGAGIEELLRGAPAPAPQPQIPPERRGEAARCLNGFLRAVGWPLPAKGQEKREKRNSLRRP